MPAQPNVPLRGHSGLRTYIVHILVFTISYAAALGGLAIPGSQIALGGFPVARMKTGDSRASIIWNSKIPETVGRSLKGPFRASEGYLWTVSSFPITQEGHAVPNTFKKASLRMGAGCSSRHLRHLNFIVVLTVRVCIFTPSDYSRLGKVAKFFE